MDDFTSGDLYLDIHGASKHLTSNGKYNEQNPGLGIKYEWGDNQLLKMFMLGEYLNSYDKQTNYIGGGVKKRLYGDDNFHVDGGIIGGAMTGYSKPIIPALLPLLSIGSKNTAVNMMFAPPVPGYSAGTLMFNTQIKLK